MLHGWPGDPTDYEALTPVVADFADVITPGLRGFGGSDRHRAYPVLPRCEQTCRMVVIGEAQA
jgi:pimeloyl-ACP methyl ester carboxylesterase